MPKAWREYIPLGYNYNLYIAPSAVALLAYSNNLNVTVTLGYKLVNAPWIKFEMYKNVWAQVDYLIIIYVQANNGCGGSNLFL